MPYQGLTAPPPAREIHSQVRKRKERNIIIYSGPCGSDDSEKRRWRKPPEEEVWKGLWGER